MSFGVLTTDTMDQAKDRGAGPASGSKLPLPSTRKPWPLGRKRSGPGSAWGGAFAVTADTDTVSASVAAPSSTTSSSTYVPATSGANDGVAVAPSTRSASLRPLPAGSD